MWYYEPLLFLYDIKPNNIVITRNSHHPVYRKYYLYNIYVGIWSAFCDDKWTPTTASRVHNNIIKIYNTYSRSTNLAWPPATSVWSMLYALIIFFLSYHFFFSFFNIIYVTQHVHTRKTRDNVPCDTHFVIIIIYAYERAVFIAIKSWRDTASHKITLNKIIYS